MEKNNGYCGYFADCYIITEKRNLNFINEFLNFFFKKREEISDCYEFPQYGKTITHNFKNAEEIIKYLVKNKNETYSIYWRNLDISELRVINCFFLNNGKLVLGLSTETKFPNTEIENNYLKKLQNFSKSKNGYIAYEEPPETNELQFINNSINKM